jgi:hypothetical protein
MGSVYNWQKGFSVENFDVEQSRQIFFGFRHLLISANTDGYDQ